MWTTTTKCNKYEPVRHLVVQNLSKVSVDRRPQLHGSPRMDTAIEFARLDWEGWFRDQVVTPIHIAHHAKRTLKTCHFNDRWQSAKSGFSNIPLGSFQQENNVVTRVFRSKKSEQNSRQETWLVSAQASYVVVTIRFTHAASSRCVSTRNTCERTPFCVPVLVVNEMISDRPDITGAVLQNGSI